MVLGCGCGVELVVCVSVVRVWLCFGVVVWFFGAVFGWAFGCQRACGVEYRAILAEVGKDALVEAVLRAPDYARDEGLPHTALMEMLITPAQAREAVGWVQSCTNR